jgi:LacI family transcriptional regulator
LGYPVLEQLLSRKAQFTAVVAFNDMSAIGMIRALEDQNMRVPADVSIIGFDDIEAAAYTSPRLTTVRQPLAEMGRIAARCLLNRLHQTEKFRPQITVEPSFVVRESTQAPGKKRNRQPQED